MSASLLAEKLVPILPGARLFGAGDADDIPTHQGAYALMIQLKKPMQVVYAQVNDAFLPAGWYLYAGNAGGPGGLRARVSRHLRTEKKPRWHVDQLTIAAETSALVFAEKNECDLIADLLASSQFTTPLPGFGSSDCRACESHLLAIK